MKINTIVAGALLGSMFVLTGCGSVLDFRERRQEVVSYDVSGALTALDITTGSGDIVVVESDRKTAHVTETIHWRGDKPIMEHPVDDGRLTLRHRCNGSHCSVDYKVEIPPGLAAELETGSGAITLRGLTGAVNATNGSGEIEAARLGSKEFVADTGSGDIEASFIVVPDRVEIESGSGDVTAHVSRGSYNVVTDTGSGDEVVQVVRDPSAPHRITMRTGSGDIQVLPS